MKSIAKMLDLSGRTALLTGAAGHVGLAAAETLLELGADVVLSDLPGKALQNRADDLYKIHTGMVQAIPADLQDEASVRSMVSRACKVHGRLDILIHNAAFVGTTEFPGWAEPFERQSVEAWDAAVRVNLTAAFIMVQEAGPLLKASGRGSVVFVSSIYGHMGPDMKLYEGTEMRHPAAYGVSKAGLSQLARYLATLLAPKVRVNTISPGGIRRGQPEAFLKRYEARTPLGRMATEEELKGAVAYLASEMSAYVTGQSLLVDGGFTAW